MTACLRKTVSWGWGGGSAGKSNGCPMSWDQSGKPTGWRRINPTSLPLTSTRAPPPGPKHHLPKHTSLKNNILELERWLRGSPCTTLTENPSSVPSTLVRQPQPPVTLATGEPTTLSGLQGPCTHKPIILTYRHINRHSFKYLSWEYWSL